MTSVRVAEVSAGVWAAAAWVLGSGRWRVAGGRLQAAAWVSGADLTPPDVLPLSSKMATLSDMPRRPRLEAPGAIHHVVVQAASDGRLVVDDADRLRFLDELRRAVLDNGWQCVAYCVMTTHVHIVVCTPTPNLSAGIAPFLGRYAYTFNRRHDRQGRLFRNRFWSRRVDKPHYLVCAALYTVLNPVAAGLCAHPRDYAWSSYRETAGQGGANGFLAPGALLGALDREPETARETYRGYVDDAVVRLGERRREEAWWRSVERAAATRATA